MNRNSKYTFSIFNNGVRLFKNTLDISTKNLDILKTWDFQEILNRCETNIFNYILKSNNVSINHNTKNNLVMVLSQKNDTKIQKVIFNNLPKDNVFSETVADKDYHLHLDPPYTKDNTVYFGYNSYLENTNSLYKKLIGVDGSHIWIDNNKNMLTTDNSEGTLKARLLAETYITSKNINADIFDKNQLNNLDWSFIQWHILKPIVHDYLSYVKMDKKEQSDNNIFNKVDGYFDAEKRVELFYETE